LSIIENDFNPAIQRFSENFLNTYKCLRELGL